MRYGIERWLFVSLATALAVLAFGQEAGLELVQQVNRSPSEQEGTGVACMLVLRVSGDPSKLYMPKSAANGSLDIGRLVFPDGLVTPITARSWASVDYVVDIPAGYGPRHTRPKLLLSWYSNKRLRSRNWTLKPLPSPIRRLPPVDPKPDVRAYHTSYDGQPAIAVWVRGARTKAQAMLSPPVQLSYELWSAMPFLDPEGPARASGNRFILTPPFAGDQDALQVFGNRVTESDSSGALSIRGARIATRGGEAFLVVPTAIVSTVPSVATISIPAQWSKIALLSRKGRLGRSALLTCTVRWLTRRPEPDRHAPRAFFIYRGPSLVPFGLEEVHLSIQAPPVTHLPAQRGPLRLGPLPPFGFAYRVSSFTAEHPLSAVVPIEAGPARLPAAHSPRH